MKIQTPCQPQQSQTPSQEIDQMDLNSRRAYQRDFFAKLVAQDEGNEFCFDCQTKGTTWVSVNNGVFLCAGCALRHKQFGGRISNVRSIEGEDIPQTQLTSMMKGGNTSMANFFAAYDLNEEPIHIKYATQASEYFRQRLRCEVEGEMLREHPPSYDEGRRLVQMPGSTPDGRVPIAQLMQEPKLAPLRGEEEAKSETDYQQMKEHASAAWKAGCNFLSEKFKFGNKPKMEEPRHYEPEKARAEADAKWSESAKASAKEKGQAFEDSWAKSKVKFSEGVDAFKKKCEEKNQRIKELFGRMTKPSAPQQPNSEDALFSMGCKSDAPPKKEETGAYPVLDMETLR